MRVDAQRTSEDLAADRGHEAPTILSASCSMPPGLLFPSMHSFTNSFLFFFIGRIFFSKREFFIYHPLAFRIRRRVARTDHTNDEIRGCIICLMAKPMVGKADRVLR